MVKGETGARTGDGDVSAGDRDEGGDDSGSDADDDCEEGTAEGNGNTEGPLGAGPRLDARPLLGEPEPAVSAVEAVSSPDHTVATGRRGSVAANVLLIDVNASGPWGAEDTAFSGAFGANVRSGAAPGLKLLAPDAEGTQALGLEVCLPTGQARGCGEACAGDMAAISGDPVTKISSPGPAT